MFEMKAHRFSVLALAVAMQLLAWREAVPACASMAHCGRTPEVRLWDPPATINGTAGCCKGGSAAAPMAVSPMPERTPCMAPAVTTVGLASPPPISTLGARGRATADVSPPLPPLLGSCILRI